MARWYTCQDGSMLNLDTVVRLYIKKATRQGVNHKIFALTTAGVEFEVYTGTKSYCDVRLNSMTQDK